MQISKLKKEITDELTTMESHFATMGLSALPVPMTFYRSNYISEENLSAFFSVGADKCLRLTWRP